LLDEYTSGTITERSFESQARLWPNYKTDYKPLTQLARKHKLKFIASNIPRRYAAMVNSGGLKPWPTWILKPITDCSLTCAI
jgi:uncharacterized iron-regulated protein